MPLITDNHVEAYCKIREIAVGFGLIDEGYATKDGENPLQSLLMNFPISTKQGLISFRETHAESYLDEAILFAETSGTTGKPLQIPRTRQDLVNGVRNYAMAYKAHLISGKDRVAFIHPSYLSPLRDITVRTLQDHDIGIMTVFPIPGLFTYDRIHAALAQNKITTLMSSPSIIHQTLYNFDLAGLGLPTSVEKIFVTGEYFSRAQADNIKRLIGREIDIIPIVYGANEIGMMMYGDAQLSYRGFCGDFVFESLALADHLEYVEELPEGSHLGELLVTGLTHSAIPIIRYATKDVFVFTPSSNGTWRFNHVGRNENLPLNLRTRNLIDDAMYSLPWPIFHYTAKLESAAAVLSVQILHSTASRISTPLIVETLSEIIPGKEIRVEKNYTGGFRVGECVPKLNRFAVA